MSRLLYLLPVLLPVLLIVYWLFLQSPPPLPNLDYNEWWGPLELKGKTDDKIRPFKIEFKNEMIKDLKQRLNATRPLTPPLEGIGFQYGFNTNYLKTLLKYWAEEYPFAERQKFLNQFPGYKTNIQGLDVHFLHVKPKVPADVEVIPLMLIHGWPGSIFDFSRVIPLLTSYKQGSDFAVEVIVPSIPGFGFSDGAVRPGMGKVEVAVIFRNLMHRLGFKKFYVQGGNWGGGIASDMITLFPTEVLGHHANGVFFSTPKAKFLEAVASVFPSLFMDAAMAERLYPLSKPFAFLIEESGYWHIQGTKPDTVGVSLTDSPAGLLAYTLEKFSTWSNHDNRALPDGGLPKHFAKEHLIDNAMVYWTSGSITTAIRIYAELYTEREMGHQLDEIPSPVPTWMIQARHEFAHMAPFILKWKYSNLLNASLLDTGGIFLALELPDVYVDDVIKSLVAFRKWHKANNVKTDL